MKQHGITLVGLGDGTHAGLTQEALDWLAQVDEIYLRTENLAMVHDISASHALVAFDELLIPTPTNPDGLDQLVDQILAAAVAQNGVTYAVPGHPLIADLTCSRIIQRANAASIPVRVIAANVLLDAAVRKLPLNFAASQITMVDTLDLQMNGCHSFSPSQPVLILNAPDADATSVLKEDLLNIYPAEHLLYRLPYVELSLDEVGPTELCQIDKLPPSSDLSMLFIPPLPFGSAFEDFQTIIAQLRAPDGCPWDREQTHSSLKPYLLEESYEALEALDLNDMDSLKEELGDLLLQIVLHAQIGVEQGEFTMRDILQTISNKMIRRHPHVFADGKAKDVEGVIHKWEEIKADERKQNGLHGKKGMLDGIPLNLPALVQSQQLQTRAQRVGFDWPDISGVHKKIYEELTELNEAQNPVEQFSEAGDVFFAMVNLARWLGVDSEAALRESNRRFKQRFSFIESAAEVRGKTLNDLSFTEMDALWDEAKEKLGPTHA